MYSYSTYISPANSRLILLFHLLLIYITYSYPTHSFPTWSSFTFFCLTYSLPTCLIRHTLVTYSCLPKFVPTAFSTYSLIPPSRRPVLLIQLIVGPPIAILLWPSCLCLAVLSLSYYLCCRLCSYLCTYAPFITVTNTLS
jgi:hypothetical protein